MAESNQWDDILAERLRQDAPSARRSTGDTSFLTGLAAGKVPRAPRPVAPDGWTAGGEDGHGPAGSSPEMIVKELTQRLSPRDETRAIEILTGRAGSGSGAGVALVAIMVTFVAGAGSFLWARSMQDRGGLLLAEADMAPLEDIREELPPKPAASTALREDAVERAPAVAVEARPPLAPPPDEIAALNPADAPAPVEVERAPGTEVRPARIPDAPALASTDGPVFSIAGAPRAMPEDAPPDDESIAAALAGPAFEIGE